MCSLTVLMTLTHGAPSPSLEGEGTHPAGGHESRALPGSSASVSRTVELRPEKPPVIVLKG